MSESHGLILHALDVAHGELVEVLDKGIQEYKANRRYSNSHDVCRCIERFVNALYQNPGGRDELRKRATLVETRCGPGSDYETARAESLKGYQGQPKILTGSKLAIGRLRKSNETPLWLGEVSGGRRDIERVLNEGILDLSDDARQAYKNWRSVCWAVQQETELLQVDGCYYLFHIYGAGEDSPSECAKGAKAITQTSMGGVNLKSIKAAADSLVDWAAENAPCHDEEQAGASVSDTNHSDDCRSVIWHGMEYTFTPMQAACIKVLWENWERGTPEVGGHTVLTELDSTVLRLRDLFDHGKHPAWNVMIRPGSTKGTYRLGEHK